MAIVDSSEPSRADLRLLQDGFVVGATNPKTIVFFGAVLPQFVDPSAGYTPIQLTVLAAVFVAIAVLSDSACGIAASRARDWFVNSSRRLEAVRSGGGLIMIGLAARLALTRRAD